MTLLERIELITNKMQTCPLSQIVQLMYPISLECQDYEGYCILYNWNMTVIVNSLYDPKADLVIALKNEGLDFEVIKKIVESAFQTTLKMRTITKDKVLTFSVFEMENLVHQLNQAMQVVDIPNGLSSADLLYRCEKADINKMQILEQKQMIEKQLSVLHSFIVARLAIYQRKAEAIKCDTFDMRIERILDRFRIVATQLKHRYDNRSTLLITDEYDVQNLLHALLKIDFNDIRAEEWVPSYAGSSLRMDFLIKDIKTVIEVKMTRDSMTLKKLGEELIVDIEKYQNHPDCDTLYCFVYDPEMRIENPTGFKNDLETKHKGFLRVIVTS